ncbi:MAG: alpha/beta fold hydrolase [Pseudomonadota bacterium]
MRKEFVWLACAAFVFFSPACRRIAIPPEQPDTGYGSSEHYITDTYTRASVGNDTDGTRAWYFIPDKLKDNTSAPAVIFLHGYTAIEPEIYYGHIEHLVKQGYIVIYPQFQRSDEKASAEDLDQTVMLTRAVASVDAALAKLGDKVDRDRLVAYGHSLGGLFAFCWHGAGGAAVQRVVMSHANMDPSTGIPAFALGLVTLINYTDPTYGPAIAVPVIMLWGNSDTDIAPFSQQQEAYELMVHAPSKVLYAAQTDGHGLPDLVASHTAPTQMLNERTGQAQQDALDYRFYYAALDAALDGQDTVTFAAGNWSDGTPVKKVELLLPK